MFFHCPVSTMSVLCWKFKIGKFNTDFIHNKLLPNLPSPLEQHIPPRRCGLLGGWMRCWNPGEMRPESGKLWAICVHVWIFSFSIIPDFVCPRLFFESLTLTAVLDLWSLTLLSEEPITKLNPPVCQKNENTYNFKHVEKIQVCHTWYMSLFHQNILKLESYTLGFYQTVF